jgi:hypothetical protein
VNTEQSTRTVARPTSLWHQPDKWVLVPVIRVIRSWSRREAEQFATKEDWVSLLVSLEKLAASVARLKGRITASSRSDAATITTAEEFAAAVRGGANYA